MGFVSTLGFILDIIIGDPPWFPHPVRGIGLLIHKLEALVRKYAKTSTALRVGGVILTAATVGGTFLLTWLFLWVCRLISPWLYMAAGVAVVYFALATRCLAWEASR